MKTKILSILLTSLYIGINAQNRIESTGNVGIGTTSPNKKLHIFGEWKNQIQFQQSSETTNFAQLSSGTEWVGLFTGGTAERTMIRAYHDGSKVIFENGNVGIGTSSPFNNTGNHGLHISKGAHSSLILGDPKSGYGGIVQTSDARQRIFIGANLYDDQNGSWSSFQLGKGSAGISLIADEGSWGTEITFITSESDGHYNRSMKIIGNGNVGIGINNPDSKLVVDGKIRSEEVKVEIINGPDYVFEPNYKLRTLEEIKQYIIENKHLPEIPSAKEMETNGIELGEMNMKLLKKIEELTLYVIEQNEELENAKKRIEELENK